MTFAECIRSQKNILMEGALGERLKREYGIVFDEHIDMGGLVYSAAGRKALEALWGQYMAIAARYQLPFLATTPTRRTNSERMACTGFPEEIIRDNVQFLREIQHKHHLQMYVGGLVGCRGDAYTGIGALAREASQSFHSWEVQRFAETKVDFLYAALMPTLEEAAGMALAIAAFQIPYILSFTIQENGRLMDGTLLSEAIEVIDSLTCHPPVGYMTNCVHPLILRKALEVPANQNARVKERFLGIQANASPLPYGELDGSARLHTTEPTVLAEAMIGLRELVPMKIFGGCCGTNSFHMEEIAKSMCDKGALYQATFL